MSRVNLLPPELRQRQAVRRNTAIVAGVGVIVLAAVGFFYFLQVLNLSRSEDDLAAQQQVNAEIEAEMSELRRFADLEAQLAAGQDLIDTVFANEVSWSAVLLDVSRAIPSNAYLTSLTGTLSAPTVGEAAPEGETPSLVGSLSFNGQALEADTIAAWLTRLEQIEGWVNAWMQSAAETGPFTRIYNFASGADLTVDAVTERGKGGPQ